MANTIDSWELEERYCDMLDECYPMVEFGDLRYQPSRVLRDVDPIAYRIGMNDYADMLISDGDIDAVVDEDDGCAHVELTECTCDECQACPPEARGEECVDCGVEV